MERHLEVLWPTLRGTNYTKTSDESVLYNCISHAVYDYENNWDPIQYFWPPNVPREETITAYIQALATKDFVPCDHGDLEAAHEKVAIYADEEGIPRHVARQLKTGEWTSKLGDLEDISHELHAVTGMGSPYPECRYGTVRQYLKRPRQEPQT